MLVKVCKVLSRPLSAPMHMPISGICRIDVSSVKYDSHFISAQSQDDRTVSFHLSVNNDFLNVCHSCIQYHECARSDLLPTASELASACFVVLLLIITGGDFRPVSSLATISSWWEHRFSALSTKTVAGQSRACSLFSVRLFSSLFDVLLHVDNLSCCDSSICHSQSDTFLTQ